jgi:hypothetical protein
VARQVVNVVLVQLAQFGSDIGDFAPDPLNLTSEFLADVGDFASNPLNLASEFLATATNFFSEFFSDITNLFSNFGLDNINFSVYLAHTVFKPLGIDF